MAGVTRVPGELVKLQEFVAEVELGSRSGAATVFPLRFRRQTHFFAGPLAQPLAELVGVRPRDEYDRVIVGLGEAGVLPRELLSGDLGFGPVDRLSHKAAELADCHLELAQVERLGNGD